MLEPVGPLPPAVYWRRRAVAVLVMLLCISLVAWVIARLASADPPSASGTLGSGSSSASDAGAPESVSSGSDAAVPADASPAATTEAPAATTEAPAPAPAPAPTGPPPVCANEQIVVSVSSDPPAITAGQKPSFVLHIGNTGADCVRDLDAASQEIRLYDTAGTRLWGSNDCYPEKSNDVRTLTTGQTVSYAVTWSGKVSEPTCTAARPRLGPGVYLLEGFQGGVTGPRVEFHIQ